MDNSIPFYRDEEKPREQFVYRSDDQALDEAAARFEKWAVDGVPGFNQDDYDILFQAGVFEHGEAAETFCRAVFVRGPVPGDRKPLLTGEDVAPRPATGEVDYRGSQRIIEGGSGE